MDKRLDTPVRVNIGGGVAGYAASNGTNCTIAAATTTTDAITYADVPAEITGATVLVAKATKVENIEKHGSKRDGSRSDATPEPLPHFGPTDNHSKNRQKDSSEANSSISGNTTNGTTRGITGHAAGYRAVQVEPTLQSLQYTAPSWSKNCDFSTPMYEIAARTCTYLNHTCSGALIQVKMTQNQDTQANAAQAQQQAQGQQHRIAIPRPGALRSPC
ncbi:hypothetical protein SMACR_05102 [Sordaria macrospora]|uniref:WGS project CABT00000000 data, contig 2.22 n=2 Tax=Sordaria macrospora TaxID=5147 RepID=F7W2N9_SORMK|nr:uncharacterized protein SMAC_05102 [Sordaria macrospora k-hell]KAA8633529.1 hypothetical protein SMACR_05102 [Sordaria macrospora]WPJ60992.1 hypothetical protein SMAC4_05102 [Sordaria macrospora]CCC11890.1 unnamed protein product [Sordaria macrospora k-hell]